MMREHPYLALRGWSVFRPIRTLCQSSNPKKITRELVFSSIASWTLSLADYLVRAKAYEWQSTRFPFRSFQKTTIYWRMSDKNSFRLSNLLMRVAGAKYMTATSLPRDVLLVRVPSFHWFSFSYEIDSIIEIPLSCENIDSDICKNRKLPDLGYACTIFLLSEDSVKL